LAEFRDRFFFGPEKILYLDGNSLGRMPKAAAEIVRRATEYAWGERLIRGYNEGWLDLPRRLGDRLAPLLGAEPGSVRVTDSTSVNFYRLAHAALDLHEDRAQIVTDALNFPSDLYLLQGIARQRNRTLRILGSPVDAAPDLDALFAAIDDRTALVALSHVAYRSAARYPLIELTAAAHQAGAAVLWDLGHSAGAVPIEFARSGAEFAVGCTYKHLNGGPGAPGFLVVRPDLIERVHNPIQGWFGQREMFAFGTEYIPAESLDRMLSGSPPVLSMVALEAGLDLVAEAGIDRIGAKVEQMTSFFLDAVEAQLPNALRVDSPRDPTHRGAHVLLGHPRAQAVCAALIDRGVMPDFRRPDGVRFGFAPLYNTYGEVAHAVEILALVMKGPLPERVVTSGLVT